MKNIISTIFVFVIVSISIIAQVTTEKIALNGLKQDVTVRRDARSIPYIEAQNDADLYFLQGYITASDRLWQMDFLRRTAKGELAEILGKGLPLEQDKQWRRYGFSQVAEESLKVISPLWREAIENYARGVNAFIATLNDTNMPLEYKLLGIKPREWRATDTVCVGKVLSTGLSSTWRNDLIRASLQKLPLEKYNDLIGQTTPYDVILFGNDSEKVTEVRSKLKEANINVFSAMKLAEKEEQIRKSSLEQVGFYAEELAASNNWVISGKRTFDGLPILANDPHLQGTAPNIWYLSHLSTPTMRVSGVTLPGSPGIIIGHNESIAWGVTNVGPDVQDLYTETFNAEGEYKTPTGWAKPKIRKEEIKVRKGFASSETDTEILEVLETRNGYMITDEVGQKFAVKWTATNPQNQEFEAFQLLNRANNWNDFKNALKTYGGPMQNFIFADIKGNIGWIAASKIPIRNTNDGALPYDGSTTAGDWIGTIPFDKLPMQYNPPSGFIATANQRIVGKNYKYQQLARDFAAPWRARRIVTLLTANSKSTIADSLKIQLDSLSIPHQKLSNDLLSNNAASDKTLSELRGWDGNMTSNSKSALIVDEIRKCIANKIADENKPLPAFVIQERLIWKIVDDKPTNWLPKSFENYAELYRTSDTESRANLTKKYGTDESKWLWGNTFRGDFFHPIGAIPLIGSQFKVDFGGINGSGVTPNVGKNVSMRYITTPGKWNDTHHGIPMGQSGNPNSPHWKDQWNDWNTAKMQLFPFTKEAIVKFQVKVEVFTSKST